jgi:hypothetical protein
LRAHLPRMREVFDAVDAERGRIVDELRVLGRDDDVARPNQHQAAHDASPLHRGDGRLRDVAPSLAQPDVEFLLARHLRLGARASEAAPGADGLVIVQRLDAVALAEVMAGGKMRPVRSEHDHLDVVVLRGGIEGVVELVEEVGVLRIARRDAIENDARDVLGRGFIDDVIEGLHGILLCHTQRAGVLFLPCFDACGATQMR